MEQPRELSALERVNQAREREAIRVVGWAALVIGVCCWLTGGGALTCVFQFGGGTGEPIFAVFLGVPAAVGCTLGVYARSYAGEPIFHARLAVALNGLFLPLALFHAVLWL